MLQFIFSPSQHFVAIRKNSDLCLGVKLVCVSLSQDSLSRVSVFWSDLLKKLQHTIQSSSVSRLSNSYMILPDIPFLATWDIAIPSTERLYISLSCYYKFHAKTKLQKYSKVFARDLNPGEGLFLGSLLADWTSPHTQVALGGCVETCTQNRGARKRNVFMGIRGSDLKRPL